MFPGKRIYNKKGFTFDPVSVDDYDKLLHRGMREEQEITDKVVLARRYAYSYFFEEMIPFPFVKEEPMSYPGLAYRDNRSFSPGADANIEAICQALLEGKLPQNPAPEQL